ncbi:MAG: hypothetical protein LBS21_02785 [Clostridiales bacterium]|nr:hypothetical protein [Clostridiales bacterium]
MKSIMELFKGDAIKFFGIDKNVVSVERTEFTQIKAIQKTDDWMLKAEDGSYIHIEFQTTHSLKDLSRFMLADAMLYYKEGKPIKTIVVYSSDIDQTITEINAGALQYGVEAFYMVKLDGDKAYAEIKAKIDAGENLTKQDLMSIVFLPMMKSEHDKVKRLERSISLSKEIKTETMQVQIQAMLELLAEKFVKDENELKKLKGMIRMGVIFDMIREDLRVELRDEVKNEVKNEVRDEVKNEIRNEVKNEVRNEVKNEVRDEVKNEVRDEVKNEVTQMITNEITEKLTNEISIKSVVEIAKIMIEDGAGISTISKYTRLSESKIRSLKADMAEAS